MTDSTNECCAHNAKGCNWCVGFNMPGYMPDSEVFHYETWEDARDVHLADIDRALDDEAKAHENGTGCEFDELVEEFKQHKRLLEDTADREASFQVGNYVYWLSKM